jgi:hypothetical protein
MYRSLLLPSTGIHWSLRVAQSDRLDYLYDHDPCLPAYSGSPTIANPWTTYYYSYDASPPLCTTVTPPCSICDDGVPYGHCGPGETVDYEKHRPSERPFVEI